MRSLFAFRRARPAAAFAAAAIATTALRIAALPFFDADLGPDEAQYWFWSRDLDYGYHSKPPLIAWTVALTTGLFGDEEWAVRLAAPLFHLGAAAYLFALARRLYDERIAFWAGLGWLTLPGVSLSSALMTTDAPLLFFWSAALYYFFRAATAREDGRSPVGDSLLLGAAVGLGMLSKYAMIYFPIGAAAALIAAPSLAAKLRLRVLVVASLVALALFAPNLAWNADNGFRTVAHTAANAAWNEALFHPGRLVGFLGSQFGVFGPAPALLLAWGLASLGARLRQAEAARPFDIALAAFALSPLLVVSAEAFIARAHANWAAAAYPSAIVLVSAWALRARLDRIIRASARVHIAAALGLIAVLADFTIADRIGLSRAVRSLRGWAEQIAEVRLAAAGYDAVLVDDREIMAEVLYYARGGPPVYARNSNGRIDSHFETALPFRPELARRVLFVERSPDPRAVRSVFSTVGPVGVADAKVGDARPRPLYLFEASGYGRTGG